MKRSYTSKALVTLGIRPPCGLFAGSLRPKTVAIAVSPLRVPQGVGLNRRGRAVENQWSWAVERFANMFANQSTVYVCRTDFVDLASDARQSLRPCGAPTDP